jgi:hypothetical protein
MQLRALGSWALLVLLATPAWAFAEPRVVVSDFKGANGKWVRKAIVDVLEDHSVELIPPKKASATAKSSGAELDTESGRVRVAKRLDLEAFVDGTTITGLKKKIIITIKVYSGHDGMQAAEFKSAQVKATTLKEIKAKFWNVIAPVLKDHGGGETAAGLEEVATPSAVPVKPLPPVAAAPQRRFAPPPPRAAPQPEQDRELPPGIVAQEHDTENEEALALEEHPDQEEPSTNRPQALDLSIGARIGSRNFGYKDSLPGLRSYSLGPSPNLAFEGRWYPGAYFSEGALANIGLDLRAELMVGVSSENSSGQKFDTSSHAFGLGVRGRLPLGALELGALVGFGQHQFGLSDAGTVQPGVPDIAHNFIRAGLEGRYRVIAPLTVQLRAAYLFGLGLGELTDKSWFPHASGDGVEAELAFRFSLTRAFGVELAVGVQRYFMSLNPEPTDSSVKDLLRVAGGALDSYYSSRFGVIIQP